MSRPCRHHHHVYVQEPSDRVWNGSSFRKANPGFQLSEPLVYVGMTGLDPDLRLDRHKAGVQANRFVLQYGLRLLPKLHAVYNPMPYEAAIADHDGGRRQGAGGHGELLRGDQVTILTGRCSGNEPATGLRGGFVNARRIGDNHQTHSICQ